MTISSIFYGSMNVLYRWEQCEEKLIMVKRTVHMTQYMWLLFSLEDIWGTFAQQVILYWARIVWEPGTVYWYKTLTYDRALYAVFHLLGFFQTSRQFSKSNVWYLPASLIDNRASILGSVFLLWIAMSRKSSISRENDVRPLTGSADITNEPTKMAHPFHA